MVTFCLLHARAHAWSWRIPAHDEDVVTMSWNNKHWIKHLFYYKYYDIHRYVLTQIYLSRDSEKFFSTRKQTITTIKFYNYPFLIGNYWHLAHPKTISSAFTCMCVVNFYVKNIYVNHLFRFVLILCLPYQWSNTFHKQPQHSSLANRSMWTQGYTSFSCTQKFTRINFKHLLSKCN